MLQQFTIDNLQCYKKRDALTFEKHLGLRTLFANIPHDQSWWSHDSNHETNIDSNLFIERSGRSQIDHHVAKIVWIQGSLTLNGKRFVGSQTAHRLNGSQGKHFSRLVVYNKNNS